MANLECEAGWGTVGEILAGSGSGSFSAPDDTTVGDWVRGALLCEVSAFIYALGIVVQKYALDMKSVRSPKVRGAPRGCLGRVWSRHRGDCVWVCGMSLYVGGNGLYTLALNDAPLALLTSLFQTTLLFNALLSRIVLGERLSGGANFTGYVLIITGIIITGIFLGKAQVNVNAHSFAQCADSSPALLYYFIIGTAVVGLTMIVLCASGDEGGPKMRTPAHSYKAATILQSSLQMNTNQELVAPSRGGYLAVLLPVAYPAVLGAWESVCQIWLKACSNMMYATWNGQSQLHFAAFYVAFGGLGLTCIAIAIWLRKGYARYEAVMMLPIQMGALTVLSVCGGLLFYQGYRDMSQLDLLMTIVGLGFILSGIFLLWVARAKKLPWCCKCCSGCGNHAESMKRWNSFPRLHSNLDPLMVDGSF